MDRNTFALTTEADQFMIDRKTGEIGCQFLIDDEQKRRCIDKVATSGNRTGISGVE